ncbi:MAG: serine/threonine protein phosphatase [Ponticaulis sp.]|nr:serine/threonine protein phosphatase [Ponticaulis sp.]|tara:strand:+ start:5960 stop:6727 length:768 start_codon:yes stop_codon:yes gene_type:complete
MVQFHRDTVFYAIGDVHGMAGALMKLHLQIMRHRADTFPDRPFAIIHLGDYVDRGPDSREVIELIMSMERRAATNPDLTVVSLKGNHEDMMIEALTGDPAFLDNWMRNGGDTTVESYRPPGADEDETMLRFPGDHLDWLKSLPDILILEAQKLVFVHAGVHPSHFPEDGSQVHLWTRSQRFFDVSRWSKQDNLKGYTVVHGHTPVDDVQCVTHETSRRINVDTGAVFGGSLTAVVLDGGAEPPTFLKIDAETGSD